MGEIIIFKLIKKIGQKLKKKNPFEEVGDQYEGDLIDRLAKIKLDKNKRKLKCNNKSFGNAERINYLYNLYRVEIALELCKFKMWFTKKEWDQHNLPISKFFQEMVISARDYSDQLKKIMSVEFKKRQRSHL